MRIRHAPLLAFALLLPAQGLAASALEPLTAAAPASAGPQEEDPELEALLAEERAEADRARRLGDLRRASRLLSEHLDDEPGDVRSRILRARVRWDEGRLEEALSDARKSLEDARRGDPALRAACARELAELHLALGEAAEAREVLKSVETLLSPELDARDAWVLGRTLRLSGRRQEAGAVLRQGAEGEAGADWQRLLARARCERALGELGRASKSLVAADAAAAAGMGAEPEVLVELAEVYFEADGEVDDRKANRRSPGVLYKQALDLAPDHEGALLGLFQLARTNWRRQRRPAHEILGQLLEARPKSIEGLLAGCASDLDDGRLVSARERLESLRGLAPRRREVRTLEAALAWVEHRRDDANGILAELASESPGDGRPERELGRTLNELYRFAEAVPFLRTAVEREPDDAEAWTELGNSLANTGDETGGREALKKAIDLAAGRQNAWRHNMAMVLERMHSNLVAEEGPGDLSYVWSPASAEVLATYLKPFYAQAREELARRYGFTPEPVHIEVFDRFQDFSVRSTGFEGFPALGVCFGPVVTSVSPVSELRGQFSWARTSFHEFTHVIHLGISHNRCPRWITEGLATWEEVEKNPAWTRNMRRELIDSLANDDLIKVRDLNRAFRGPRILFGYYQGGLLCQMLIEEHGAPPMIRILEAFDRGLDLDEALREVFDATPEEIDERFLSFVRREVADLHVEPRWTQSTVVRKKYSLSDEPPADDAGRRAWADDLTTVAWGHWQARGVVDTEEALRRLSQAGLEPPRALFLRGEMALAKKEPERASRFYRAALAAGGEDYRARMALGTLALQEEDYDEAEAQFLAAEAAFPGYPEKNFNAELHLAQVYAFTDRVDDMQRVSERWLRWNADDYPTRVRVAGWHADQGRFEEAEKLYREANEVDPFRRALHAAWGGALFELGRHEEALREWHVTSIVPPELDLDDPGPLSDGERAELLGRSALSLSALGRTEEAARVAREALALDEDCEPALSALEELP